MRKLNLLMASSAVGLVAMAGSVSIAPRRHVDGLPALDALTYHEHAPTVVRQLTRAALLVALAVLY